NGSISEYESNILKAAARAQRETGVPIITHTESGTMGPEQADLLLSEGAEPSRVAIGHMVGNSDLAYHLATLDRGMFIAFDRLGLDAVCPGRLAKGCIIGLLGIGFEKQIMLSHDYVRHFPGNPLSQAGALREVMPNWSYTHIMIDIMPDLKRIGVSDEQIRTLMIDNPRRLFGG
ncbi:MAG: phosphotriesterase-related protein, partial [Dehalococcoidia bacterium]|nr:phosphotriesterase-related protein [Dehalococcoidia bacterium]